MNSRRILLVVICVLLALPPLACSLTPVATDVVEPTFVRPTRTPPDHVLPTSRPQATSTPPALPTQRPTSDPASTLYERDYGSEGMAFEDAFISTYGQALVVFLEGEPRIHVVNLEDGWEATFANPLQSVVSKNAVSVKQDRLLLAEYMPYENGIINIWSVTPDNESELIAEINEQDVTVINLVFSPDGKTLAVGYNTGEIRLYRTDGGALQRTIKTHHDFVTSLSYSWDGRYLLTDSTSFDSCTYVFNASTGARVAMLSEESWNPAPPVFSPDGSMVSAVSDTDGTHIFTTNNWQPAGVVLAGVWDGVFTCDSSAFMVDQRDQTEIYSLETGALVATLDVGWLYCTADGRTVMIDLDYDNYILVVRIISV